MSLRRAVLIFIISLSRRLAASSPLTEDVFGNLFQVVSAPSDEVQFLYALFDEGTGREFQSQPLLNTAG